MPRHAFARPTRARHLDQAVRARAGARSQAPDEAVITLDLAHRWFARIARFVERFEATANDNPLAGNDAFAQRGAHGTDAVDLQRRARRASSLSRTSPVTVAP